jgi:hypothetical protein
VNDLAQARHPWLHFGDDAVELSDADAERIGTDDPSQIDV